MSNNNPAYKTAQDGLQKIQAAIIELLKQHPEGLSNSEIATTLGLQSDQDGKQRDYLTWSILGLMKRSETVVKTKAKNRCKYTLR